MDSSSSTTTNEVQGCKTDDKDQKEIRVWCDGCYDMVIVLFFYIAIKLYL